MKCFIPGLALLMLAGAAAGAQTTTGTVHYQETISFSVPKLEGEAAQFAALMPKEKTLEHVLYFNPGASMFQSVAPKEPDNLAGRSEGIQIMMDVPQEKYYTDLREGQRVALHEFFGRKFLVTGAPQKQSWKMTGKQKTILSYPCQEAVLYREQDTVTAWFTTSIPVSIGPRGLSGLPGLILATQEGTHSSIVATAVDAAVPPGAIAVPKGGKKVTDEQFKAIVDAKMAEMGASKGPGGEQIMIKVQNN